MEHRKFLKLLKKEGFELVNSGKHQQWSNGKLDLYVPHKKQHGLSKGLYHKFLKQIEEARNEN